MFAFGLIASVCFIPGFIGALIPTQWALFSCVLPLGLWRRGSMGPATWAGLATLAWAALSFLWTPDLNDSAYGLWLLTLCALALWFGTTIHDFRPLLSGLAFGLTISSGVAIAQALGFAPVATGSAHPSGLLYNSTVLGTASALTIIALFSHEQFRWVPGLLPGLFLSHSRGALLIIAAVFLTNLIRPRWVFALCVIGFAVVTAAPSPSDIQRLMLWGLALRNLDFLGHGIGSVASLAYYNPTDFYIHAAGFFQAGYIHNDYLQLWFELGVGALGIYFIYAVALTRIDSPLWSTFFGFAILGLFYFPLYCPLTAFIGCVAAGRLINDWHYSWRIRTRWRLDRLLWNPY